MQAVVGCSGAVGGRGWELRSAHLRPVREEALFQGAHFLLERPELLLFSGQHLEVPLVLLLPLQHLIAHVLQLFVEGLHLLGSAQ